MQGDDEEMSVNVSNLLSLLRGAGIDAQILQNSNGLELRMGVSVYYVPASVDSVVETVVAHNNFQWNEVVWG